MSEKRFKLIKPLGTQLGLKEICIKDTQKDYYYNTKETVVNLLNELSKENEQLKSLVNACEYGQKSLMEEMKHSDEALDKIWEIMKDLYGVVDDE